MRTNEFDVETSLIRKTHFLPKEVKERKDSREIHRPERSITSWARCFQNSPWRYYYVRTQKEREESLREREGGRNL